jgi:ribose transport system substrate-binding protein
MRTRLLLYGGLVAFVLAGSLYGCDPNKGADKSADTKSAVPSEPTASSAPTTSAFDKPRKETGDLTIKVITNGTDPFWDTMGKGLEVGLKETGTKGGWLPPAGTDNNSQKDTFEQQMAAGVDGIAVSPIQAEAFASVIDEAIDKGTPVITFDSDAPTSKRLAYIGTNNYDAGQKAGEAAVKLFPSGGNLVAFVGNMSADNARQRYQGFVDAVKGHNITMLQPPFEDDKDQVGKAHSNVADAITKYGDKINGFLGLYAYNGPAIVDEVQKAGKLGKVKIICFDGVAKTLDNLSKKLVDVTVVQKPFEFGRLAAKLLTLINRKGLDAGLKDLQPELEKAGMKVDTQKHIIDTGVTVVTPENAAAFLKELHDKGLTST